MNLISVKRLRFKKADSLVKKFLEKEGAEPFKQAATSIGNIIMINGLLQTFAIAVVKSPDDEVRKEAINTILGKEGLCDWLKNEGPTKDLLKECKSADPNNVFEFLMSMENILDYQRIEEEAISYLTQVKLVAQMHHLLLKTTSKEEKEE